MFSRKQKIVRQAPPRFRRQLTVLRRRLRRLMRMLLLPLLQHHHRNQLLALDGRFRLDKQTTTTFQLLGTTSRNFFFNPNDGVNRYRTGNGLGYTFDYNVSGRNWGYELYGEGFTRDYCADVGFVQRTNSNFNFAFIRYNSDFDFGNGNKYPRVSPAALLLGQSAPLDPGRGSLLQFNGGITYQPTNALRMSFSLNKQRLRRYDTDRVAFDVNILNARGTYQFTKATFARLILDYSTINSRLRSQALFGWTPSPGTAFYVGYNDDLNYESPHPFRNEIVPGFRRNSRVFFIKMSYLIRKSF